MNLSHDFLSTFKYHFSVGSVDSDMNIVAGNLRVNKRRRFTENRLGCLLHKMTCIIIDIMNEVGGKNTSQN